MSIYTCKAKRVIFLQWIYRFARNLLNITSATSSVILLPQYFFPPPVLSHYVMYYFGNGVCARRDVALKGIERDIVTLQLQYAVNASMASARLPAQQCSAALNVHLPFWAMGI